MADIGDDGNRLGAEAYDHADERIDKIGPLEEVIVERVTLERCCAIEYDANLLLVWIDNGMVRNIPDASAWCRGEFPVVIHLVGASRHMVIVH